MHVFRRKTELNTFLRPLRCQEKNIGFVPTMGALHKGHMHLIREALHATDLVVCSIFVNPTQFNNTNDLANYPRTLAADLQMLEEAGCHAVFCPDENEMYPEKAALSFRFGPLEEVMEGAFRPGHFAGVGLVVSKLFNIVQPDVAFFGQKDLQQCRIIQQLTRELSLPVEIRCIETIREEDGLALSSRNRRLTEEHRKQATGLYKALQAAAESLEKECSVNEAQERANAVLKRYPAITLEYFTIADGGTLQQVQDVAQHEQLALCIAAWLGDVRLIDNLIVDRQPALTQTKNVQA